MIVHPTHCLSATFKPLYGVKYLISLLEQILAPSYVKIHFLDLAQDWKKTMFVVNPNDFLFQVYRIAMLHAFLVYSCLSETALLVSRLWKK